MRTNSISDQHQLIMQNMQFSTYSSSDEWHVAELNRSEEVDTQEAMPNFQEQVWQYSGAITNPVLHGWTSFR